MTLVWYPQRKPSCNYASDQWQYNWKQNRKIDSYSSNTYSDFPFFVNSTCFGFRPISEVMNTSYLKILRSSDILIPKRFVWISTVPFPAPPGAIGGGMWLSLPTSITSFTSFYIDSTPTSIFKIKFLASSSFAFIRLSASSIKRLF